MELLKTDLDKALESLLEGHKDIVMAMFKSMYKRGELGLEFPEDTLKTFINNLIK